MTRIFLMLILFPVISQGQNYTIVNTPTDTFYVINSIDTFSIPANLPSGKWKMYFENDSNQVKYVFTVRNNKVDGNFIQVNSNGFIENIGNYQNDSLWTFRFGSDIDSDTTYKVGKWAYYYRLGPTVEFMTHQDRHYKMNFNSDSLFNQTWYYENGLKFREMTYHQNAGLISDIVYYKNGKIVKDFKKENGYAIKKEFNSVQNLEKIYIDCKLKINLVLDPTSITWNSCDSCKLLQTYDSNGKIISSTWITESGRIKEFSDEKVKICYDNDGNIERIDFKNRRNRWKSKIVK